MEEQNMKNKINTNHGITLIALIITIIILLILAGISLNLIAGSNGILSKAENATITNDNGTVREEVELKLAEINMEYYETNIRPATLSEVTTKFVLDTKFEVTDSSSDPITVVSINHPDILIQVGTTERGTIEIISVTKSGEVAAVSPTAGKTANSSNRTLSGATTGYTYQNPVIPQGFNAVDAGGTWSYTDGTKTVVTGWDDGLVIQDSIGNQFVWVPVDGETVTYGRSSFITGSEVTDQNTSDAADTITIENITYSAIPVTESTQINEYGGFYVARFEAGLTSATQSADTNNVYTAVPVSIAVTKIWNYIDYAHAYVAAERMINDEYSGNTVYGNIKSGLITGKQWDTIMIWYKSSTPSTGVESSTQNWGTYRNLNYTILANYNYFIYNGNAGNWTSSTSAVPHTASSSEPYHFHSAGANAAGIKKNIADLAGNIWEWSSEVYSSYRVMRGGAAWASDVSENPASRRNYGDVNGKWESIGFRCVLYIQ